MESRIRRIFAVAAYERNDVLVLGAFGCGAFRNPPEVVAKVFHKVMDDYREYFETIEYAVFHTDKETENYKSFEYEFRQCRGINENVKEMEQASKQAVQSDGSGH